MASVTNLMTRIHDCEGTLTTGNIPSGGGGAAANLDIFLQQSQSLGKRITVTATTEGFAIVDAADNNCSGAGCHVGAWIWVTHYSIMDDLRIALCTGTTPSSNYKYWTVPLSEFPPLGGWKRVWLENNVGGTVGAGTYTPSQTRCVGVMVSFSATPGGNAANLILDASDYVIGAALSLAGASGLWSDFSAADQAIANQYGVFREVGGVYNCFARVQLGSASSLAFNDSGFTIIFPQQALVADTWMGINIDLQHASTDIDWANGVVKSAGAKKGDLVVTGTSGVFDATGMTFDSLRIITLTSKATITASAFRTCGLITQAGAVISGCTISGGTAAASILASNPSNISGCTFISDGSNHAIEIDTPGEYNLTGNIFTGYATSNGSTGNEVIHNNSNGYVKLNVSGGSGTVSVRNSGSSTTDIAASLVPLTINNLKNHSEVRVYNHGTTTELAGEEDNTTGTFTWNYNPTQYSAVDIHIVNLNYIDVYYDNQALPSGGVTIPVQQQVDRQYANP